MATVFVHPERWPKDELQARRDRAEVLFTEQRRTEGPVAYAGVYAELLPRVAAAFAATDDLRSLTEEALLTDPGLWQILRYCCAPPISEEDLWTMVGRKFKRLPADVAGQTAEAIGVAA